MKKIIFISIISIIANAEEFKIKIYEEKEYTIKDKKAIQVIKNLQKEIKNLNKSYQWINKQFKKTLEENKKIKRLSDQSRIIRLENGKPISRYKYQIVQEDLKECKEKLKVK